MDASDPRQQQEQEHKAMSKEQTTAMKALAEEEAGDGHNHRGWKAMPYVIGNETFEKLGTIGTLSNMLVYLTTVYHMPSVNAATLLNVFSGTSNLATVLGAYVSDTYLGRYTTIAAATVSSFIGMLILTLTAAIHTLHPPACDASKGQQCEGPTSSQLAAILVSFFFLVVGAGGIRPCNLAFGADQFDPRTADGRRGIASFFNWYYITTQHHSRAEQSTLPHLLELEIRSDQIRSGARLALLRCKIQSIHGSLTGGRRRRRRQGAIHQRQRQRDNGGPEDHQQGPGAERADPVVDLSPVGGRPPVARP